MFRLIQSNRPLIAIAFAAMTFVISACDQSAPPDKPTSTPGSTPTLGESPTAATTQPAAPPEPIPFKPIPHVEKRGHGPINMVLIPSFTLDWTTFETFMDRNGERYTMYAVTLPGFGGSEPPAMPAEGVAGLGAWNENALKGIWQVVQDNKLEQPVIVGHYLGGHLALRLALMHPKEIRAVVSIDGKPAMPLGVAEKLSRAERESYVLNTMQTYKMVSAEEWPVVMAQMITPMVSNPDRGVELAMIAAKTSRDVALQYLGDFFAADISDDLANLHIPALAIAAVPTSDLQAPAAQDYRNDWLPLVKQAAKLDLVFFEHTRQFVMDDRPAELDAAIADFLAGRKAKGVPMQAGSPAAAPMKPGSAPPPNAPSSDDSAP